MNPTQDDKVEAKRASNRERQARYRQRAATFKAENAVLRRVLAEVLDVRDDQQERATCRA